MITTDDQPTLPTQPTTYHLSGMPTLRTSPAFHQQPSGSLPSGSSSLAPSPPPG